MFSHTHLWGAWAQGVVLRHVLGVVCQLLFCCPSLRGHDQLDNASQRYVYVRIVTDNRGIVKCYTVDQIEHGPFALSITIILSVIMQN